MASARNIVRLIAKLEAAAEIRKQQVDALEAERRRLHAQACATQLVLQQVDALIRMRSLLEGSGAHTHPGIASPAGADAVVGHHSRELQAQLEDFRAKAARVHGALPALLDVPLKWSPEAAAAVAPEVNLVTPDRMMDPLSDYIKQVVPLLNVVRSRAPGKQAALQQLDELHASLSERYVLSCYDVPLGSRVMIPVAHLSGSARLEEGRVFEESPVLTPEQLTWAAEQLGLSSDQEELLLALLGMWEERVKSIMQQCGEALRQLREASDGGLVGDSGDNSSGSNGRSEDATEGLDIVKRIDALQASYLIMQCSFALAAYALMRGDQIAQWFVNCQPYTPSPQALLQALRHARAARRLRASEEEQQPAAAAGAAAASAAAAAGGQAGGRIGGGDGEWEHGASGSGGSEMPSASER